MLASGGQDRSLRLWDVETGEAIGQSLSGQGGAALSVAFSPDGGTLASAGDDETIVLWDVDLKSWLARACGITNRNLTTEEWERYLGEQSYRKSCPDLP